MMPLKPGTVSSMARVVSRSHATARYLLTSADYGNEVEAGQGVSRAIKDGSVKREELFIVSKLWNTFHEKEHVEPACRKQLKDWGLEYFDLFIMHFRTFHDLYHSTANSFCSHWSSIR
jgi:diketogulonate reductase-like aldo/keto reductase